MAKSKNFALGRDFYSLLDDNKFVQGKESAVNQLRISDIEPRQDQPRHYFSPEKMQALADSIAEFGVLQPILVTANPNAPGMYRIIAGERRWRAAKLANLKEIPAIVMNADEMKTAQMAVIENMQRENLNPVEEALAFKSLIESLGMTQEAVAKRVGKSRSAITNTMRLLDLPDEVLEFVKNGSITEGHARALLGLEDKTRGIALCTTIVEKEMSVRDVERTVKLMNYHKDEDAPVDEGDLQKRSYMKDLEHRMTKALGYRVKIVTTGKKKMVQLPYKDDEELEFMIRRICGDDFFAEER